MSIIKIISRYNRFDFVTYKINLRNNIFSRAANRQLTILSLKLHSLFSHISYNTLTKKYIFVIVIVLAIVSVSFIERNTVFDSMIITGLAVEIEGGIETYYLEYLSKEKNNIYVIQSDIMSIKKDVKKATGKDVTF